MSDVVARAQVATRNLVYISDGSRGSDRVADALELVTELVDALKAARAEVERIQNAAPSVISFPPGSIGQPCPDEFSEDDW